MNNSDQSTSAFALWVADIKDNPYQPLITSIILVTIILVALSIYYYVKMRKLDVKQAPSGLALFIYLLVNYMNDLVYDVIGEKGKKLVPYFIALLFYLTLSNIISLIGFDNPTNSLTITFTMGFVMFFGTIIFGLRYQKADFFLKFLIKFDLRSKKNPKKKYPIYYCVNPLPLLDYIGPLISISLRLWANIFAGGLILALLYSIPLVFFRINPLSNPPGPQILIFFVVAIPFHIFFDIIIGLIQAFVFTLLTMSYWSIHMTKESEYDEIDGNVHTINLESALNSELNQQTKGITNLINVSKT